MNTPSRKTLIAGGVAALVLAGGAVFAVTSMDNDELSDDELAQASAAALAETGGGTVTSAEAGEENGEPAYDIEVRTEDGRSIDVFLDENFEVIGSSVDDDDSAQAAQPTDGTSAQPNTSNNSNTTTDDDPPLTDENRKLAEAAAIDAVGGGEALSVDTDDDGTEAYDVEVRATDGRIWNIELNDKFEVVDRDLED